MKFKMFCLSSSVPFYINGEMVKKVKGASKDWAYSRSWDGKRFILKHKASKLTVELPLDEVCLTEWNESVGSK